MWKSVDLEFLSDALMKMKVPADVIILIQHIERPFRLSVRKAKR